MTKTKFLIYSTLFLFVFSSCNKKSTITRTDTETSGTAQIACDENFSKVMEQQIAVYENDYDEAHLKPVYGNEVDVINFLLKDSIRLAFTYRELTPAEQVTIKQKGRILRSQKIATDGVALIINKSNTDSLISVSTIKEILSGKVTKWNQINPYKKSKNSNKIQVVFDNPNSSTVRYLKDSIAGGSPLAENLRSMRNSKEVLDYVSNHKDALGIIGVNWISNPKDTTNLSFDSKIHVMSVSMSNPAFPDDSYKPFPAYLALGQYPLTRNVYMLLSDVRGGLPAGFAAFVAGDTGQRIILKAGLVPATRPMRLVSLKENF
ncbi:MAG: substrate-binding domain-containing protein [Dysgonamonadaceae bacterium]